MTAISAGGRHLRWLAVLVAMGLTALGGTGSVFAQEDGDLVDDQTYETADGVEFTWDEPWAIFDDRYGYNDDVEADQVHLIFDGDPGQQLFLREYPAANGDLDDVLDAIHDDYMSFPYVNLLIDERDASEAELLYSAASGDGPPTSGFFVRAVVGENDNVYAIVTSARVETFGDNLEAIEDAVEIDGDPALDGVDIDLVVETLDANDPIESSGAEGIDGNTGTDDDAAGSDDEADEDASSDADAYVADVQDLYDELSAAHDDFTDVMGTPDFSEDDELVEIMFASLEIFEQAPGLAAELDPPAGYDDLNDLAVGYAGSLSDIADALADFSSAETDSTEADEAWERFLTALDEAEDLRADLEDELGNV